MIKNTDKLERPSISRAVSKIAEMPIGRAEKAIEAFADRNGDEFAQDILGHLPPVKIAAILRQHDFSCPSIISWIMTPKMIVDVLKIDPLFWQHVYNKYDLENFYKIQNDALDLISSLLFNAENRDQQSTILQHISDDGLSLLYLFLPFVGWDIKEDQSLDLEDPEIDLGTVDHLYEIVRWAAPYVAEQISDFAGSANTSLFYYIMDLWSEAFQCFEKGRDFSSIEKTMFLPVD